MASLENLFVKTPKGFGKVKKVDKSKEEVNVELFHSIARRVEVAFPSSQIDRSHPLPHQIAAYEEKDGKWLQGRITKSFEWNQNESNEYEVEFVNHEARYVSEENLFVPCSDAVSDPVEVLSVGGWGSQYFYDRRLPLMKCLFEQRAQTRGITSLISSSIELAPHQLDVVRRVLEDPLTRFLLADEVGMGKTIEACVIIRQLIEDGQVDTVSILVPDHLTSQWEYELESKFQIDYFPGNVNVYPFSEISDVDPDTDFLIIDEVHRIFHSLERGSTKQQDSLDK